MDEAMRLKKDVRDRDHARSYEDEDDEDWEDDEEDYDPKMEKITTILAVVAALLIGGILIFLVGRIHGVSLLLAGKNAGGAGTGDRAGGDDPRGRYACG